MIKMLFILASLAESLVVFDEELDDFVSMAASKAAASEVLAGFVMDALDVAPDGLLLSLMGVAMAT